MLLLALIIHISAALGAQTANDWFEKGLEAFRWQKTTEAVTWFSKASEADSTSDEYLLYLGTCHHQLGQNESAEAAYTAGISLNGPNREQLLLNRGNLRMTRGDYEGSKADFDRLQTSGGSLAAAAVLNRANLQLNTGYFSLALDDYSTYLVMDPMSAQKDVIEELIGMLSAQIASDAEMALLAAEQARLTEEARLAEEARIAREEAERAAQMEELLNSLSDSGNDTTNIGAGTEDIVEDFEDSELED